jgi:hypothetical protein
LVPIWYINYIIIFRFPSAFGLGDVYDEATIYELDRSSAIPVCARPTTALAQGSGIRGSTSENCTPMTVEQGIQMPDNTKVVLTGKDPPRSKPSS